jgi:hypothetical protein
LKKNRTALLSSHKQRRNIRVTTIIFAETVEEEEEVLRLEQKEIEMIKSQKRIRVKETN